MAGPWEKYASAASDQAGAEATGPWSKYQAPASPQEPGMLAQAGRAILDGVAQVGSAIDSYSGAPVRAAVGALEDGKGIGSAARAYRDQFGADPALAPTGRDLVKKVGVSDAPLADSPGAVIDAATQAGRFDPYTAQAAAFMGAAKAIPRSQAAGIAADVATDPLTYVPVGRLAKGAAGLVGRGLSGSAERLAVKATGATGKQAAEFAPGAGRELLDRGLVRFGSSQSAMADRAATALEQSGKNIGDALTHLDAHGAGIPTADLVQGLRSRATTLGKDPSKFSVSDGLNRLADRLEAQASARSPKPPAAAPTPEVFPESQAQEQLPLPAQRRPTLGRDPETGRIVAKTTPPTLDNIGPESFAGDSSQLALPFPTQAPKPDMVPLTAAEQTKRGFQASVNWASSPNETSLAKEAADVYRQAVEDAATKANPHMAAKFAQSKADFKLMAPIAEAAQKRALTLQQSPHGGVLDFLALEAGGELGALSGGPTGMVAGMGAGYAAKALRPRIASTLAVSADKLSKGARALGAGVAPSVAAARGTNFLQQESGSSQQDEPQPAAPVLANRTPARGEAAWAQKGAQALGITDPSQAARLLQDPRARDLLIQASGVQPGSRAMKAIKDKIQKGWQ